MRVLGEHGPGTMGPGRKSWMGRIPRTDPESGQGRHEQESGCDDGREPVRQRGGGKGCEATWESRSG